MFLVHSAGRASASASPQSRVTDDAVWLKAVWSSLLLRWQIVLIFLPIKKLKLNRLFIYLVPDFSLILNNIQLQFICIFWIIDTVLLMCSAQNKTTLVFSHAPFSHLEKVAVLIGLIQPHPLSVVDETFLVLLALPSPLWGKNILIHVVLSGICCDYILLIRGVPESKWPWVWMSALGYDWLLMCVGPPPTCLRDANSFVPTNILNVICRTEFRTFFTLCWPMRLQMCKNVQMQNVQNETLQTTRNTTV